MGLLKLKVNGEYVIVAQGPAGPIGPPGIISSPATLEAGTASEVPLTITGAVGQTANLQEWRDDTGGTLMSVSSNGRLNLKSYRETTTSFTSSGTWNVDPSQGTIISSVPSGDTTIDLALLANGDSLLIRFYMPTLYNITWPTIWWAGGNAPAFEAGKYHWVSLWKMNNVVWGSDLGAFSQ